MTTLRLKTPLRYFGAKTRLAPRIVAMFPPHEAYVEPFAGSAAVLLAKPRCANELINDLDSDVVNLFRLVRDRPEDLARAVELTPFALSERSADCESDIDRARLYLLRSWSSPACGSTGLRRSRSRRAPGGDWGSVPRRIRRVTDRLQGVVIDQRCAFDVFEWSNDREVLLYVDPPYRQDTRGGGGGYEHDDLDHDRLIDVLSNHRGRIVLSGYDHPAYAKLGWECVRMMAHASVPNRTADTTRRTECVWLNPSACQQPTLFQSVMHHTTDKGGLSSD